MDNIIDIFKKNKTSIIVCIILLILAIFVYYFLTYDSSKEFVYETDNEVYLKKYGVNEYIPVYVTEEDIARIYLNDFKNKMISNANDAYEVLNNEYKEKKFGSLENFTEYLDEYIGVSTYTMEVDKYEVVTLGGNKYFNIYDKTGEHFIFKENSIMNYEVYLDEYTIPIE